MGEEAPTRPSRRPVADPATVMAGLALVVSIAALLVSVYEAGVLREQQRAQVWPYMSFGTSFGSQGFSIAMENKGAGPAIVRGMSLTVNGQVVTDPIEAVVASIPGDEPPFGYDVIRTARVSDAVVSPGEVLMAFATPWTPETRAVFQSAPDISGWVCYCSIHGECWTTPLNGRATPGACEAPDRPYQ